MIVPPRGTVSQRYVEHHSPMTSLTVYHDTAAELARIHRSYPWWPSQYQLPWRPTRWVFGPSYRCWRTRYQVALNDCLSRSNRLMVSPQTLGRWRLPCLPTCMALNREVRQLLGGTCCIAAWRQAALKCIGGAANRQRLCKETQSRISHGAPFGGPVRSCHDDQLPPGFGAERYREATREHGQCWGRYYIPLTTLKNMWIYFKWVFPKIGVPPNHPF